MKKIYVLILFFGLMLPINSIQAQALDFDGSNDYVQTTYSGISGTADRTIEAWIKTTANFIPNAGGLQGVIVDWGTFSTGQRFTFNVLWSNAIRIEVGGNGVSGTIPVNDGNWHHVAAVFSNPGNNVALYVDGVLDTQGSLTVAANTAANGNNVMIGRRVDGVNFFTGSIDEVRIWNTARSAAEIQANMNNELCGSNPNLMAYYKFNQGVAGGNNAGMTTATDNSGNGNNGTLNGFALSGSTSNWVTGKTLTTGNNSSSSFSVTACDSYTAPSGATFNSSQTVTDVIPNAAGCDSVMTINLTINNNTSSSFSITSCGAYTAPSGTVYNSSQTVTDVISNAAGCDSVMTISLVVFNVDTSVTQTNDTLIANGVGAFQWLNCDTGMPVAGATSSTFVPTASGNYAVELTVNSCVDTSSCYAVIVSNTQNQNWNAGLKYYPNPVNDQLNIELGKVYNDLQLSIYSVDGKAVLTQNYTQTEQIGLDLNIPNGVYFVELKNAEEFVVFKILKE